MFHVAPEDPYTKWDKVWLDRARVILYGRRDAELARAEQKRSQEKKAIDGNQSL